MEQAKPLGKYPYLKRAGDSIYLSGMSARLADGSIPEGVREQTRVVIEKIRAILQSEGADLSDCVAVTSYLVDMADFDLYNTVYGEYFNEQGPTRTTVAVHQLPHPQMRVELTVTAYQPDAHPPLQK
ncbi:2-aminomuconate deaminase [Herbaspirillum sp. Sphag1AN]|uniref:RidA family protein n=1 Tax=unclassified Herbaspirillum TaxID=2624150 RepID=UPI00161693FF|nr:MULTISPECIES: RidA family protein [unclassified Herbaspirillum]MBB3211059.1 2-aminomuconate deaminase [Herbaspirillum sp. Sphag1AN]MBB3244688.1 2-aminomuconate deaminase [Herbaspirillum sp. Sphag64]